MRRVFLALLMAVLAVYGVAPCAAFCRSCRMESSHECCAPANSMQANCCAGMQDSNAVAPVAGQAGMSAPAAGVWMEMPPSVVISSVVFFSVVQRPPGVQVPQLILRI
jgi:hypothetical protein